MAFVVEDGTGKPDATAYCDVAFADSYFADEGGNSAWTAANPAQKQNAIVKATRYIDQRFAKLFRGVQSTNRQALQWPRACYGEWRYGSNEMPIELKRACAEYAVRSLSASLIADPVESQEIEEKSVSVGPISKKTRFAVRQSRRSAIVSNAAFKDYPAADMWIEPLLRSASHELSRV